MAQDEIFKFQDCSKNSRSSANPDIIRYESCYMTRSSLSFHVGAMLNLSNNSMRLKRN